MDRRGRRGEERRGGRDVVREEEWEGEGRRKDRFEEVRGNGGEELG